MTAGEVIALVDALRPNQYGEEQKLRWLRRLDGQILAELESTHEPGPLGFVPAEEAAGTEQPALPETGEEEEEDQGTGAALSPQGGSETAQALCDVYTTSTRLLAPFPYDEELYTAYLFCQIDLHNAEIQKYNQSLSLLAAAWRQLADWINRSRRPKGVPGWKL